VTAERVVVDIREFADLSDGRRIVTEWRHGSKTLQAPRGQLGVASVERDIRRLMGQRGFMERVNGWASRARADLGIADWLRSPASTGPMVRSRACARRAWDRCEQASAESGAVQYRDG
jgi:hypothetical protein